MAALLSQTGTLLQECTETLHVFCAVCCHSPNHLSYCFSELNVQEAMCYHVVWHKHATAMAAGDVMVATVLCYQFSTLSEEY